MYKNNKLYVRSYILIIMSLIDKILYIFMIKKLYINSKINSNN